MNLKRKIRTATQPTPLSLTTSGQNNYENVTMEAIAWKTCEDPILQISIECPTNWNMNINKDGFDFEPDAPSPDTTILEIPTVSVEIEPVFPMDTPDKFMRKVVNEDRQSDTKILGLNETTVNERPAYRAHYNNDFATTLQYFLVDTNDYTGYTLEYEVANENFTQHLPIFERMANSFQITK